jgi:hypothetical protein
MSCHPGTSNSPTPAEELNEREGARVAASMISPYEHRRDVTVEEWSQLGKSFRELPSEQRESAMRTVLAAVNRQDLVPPAGIHFLEVLLTPSAPPLPSP